MIYRGKEITPGLERISRLMQLFGDPQDKLPAIHIAGTNGKGSTGAYIVSILRKAGCKVGHFHTPALRNKREEIQIDGEWIRQPDLEGYERRILQAVNADFLEAVGPPSPFEMETAAAFLYFYEKGCDYAVIECGLGGRLDATNILRKPRVCVLTSIGMDHMEYLGDSLPAIAREKCGIIKEGSAVISCDGREEVCEVIRQSAEDKGADLTFVSDVGLTLVSAGLEEGQTFDLGEFSHLHIQSPAFYQPVNAALAVMAVLALQDTCIPLQAIRDGLEEMVWPARFEIVSRRPLIMYDGAHNPDAARVLAGSLLSLCPGRDLILILGVLADKDYREMLRIFAELAPKLITFTPPSPRALPACELAREAKGSFPQVFAADGLYQAWRKAAAWRREMPDNTVLMQCGTLSAYASFCSVYAELQDELEDEYEKDSANPGESSLPGDPAADESAGKRPDLLPT